MSDHPQLNTERFDELMSDVLEHAATPEQVELFNECLRQDPQARARYIAYIDLHAALADPSGPLSATYPTDLQDDRTDIMSEVIDQALALRRQHEVEDEANQKLAAQQAEDARNRRFELRRYAQPAPVKRVIVIPQVLVWLGVAAVLGIAATVVYQFGRPAPQATTPPVVELAPEVETPVKTNVAFIRGSVDARWVGLAYDSERRLAGGKTVTLRDGLAEIVFDNGAAVIIQGPATFEPTGPNAMRLDTGRMTAMIPDTAHGFTVATPGGLITDYGTEFGLHVNTDGQTLAQTFTGHIGLTPAQGGAEVNLLAGEARIAATSGRVREVESDELAFVRREEFEAILHADYSPRDRWVARRYQLLRDRGVVAFVPFLRSGSDWPDAIGVRGMRVIRASHVAGGQPGVAPGSEAFGPPIGIGGDQGFGSALVTDGVNPVYIDLDTRPGGPFDQAGLLDETGLIGRSGTTLYLSWRTQGEAGGLDPDAFAGLSLMPRTDVRVSGEPVFFGLASSSAMWSVQARPVLGGNRPDQVFDLAFPPGSGDARQATSSSHLWLVQIDFQDGPDRVQVWLDPDLEAPALPAPNLTVEGYPIAFDRVRCICGNGATGWRFDDLLITTTRPSVLPGDVSGD